jgi:hypothetical protein
VAAALLLPASQCKQEMQQIHAHIPASTASHLPRHVAACDVHTQLHPRHVAACDFTLNCRTLRACFKCARKRNASSQRQAHRVAAQSQTKHECI